MRTYNLHETHVHDTDPWVSILTLSASAVRSTYHLVKGKSQGQLFWMRHDP